MFQKPSGDGGRPTFPIVGIGASAGGLEALELFLAAAPPDSGMAFVIVQHLDPTHKGIMVELLQRSSRMPVVQVKDRMRVRPDHVYVIPPNKDMSILRDALHLLVPSAPRGLRLPIDYFFRSLAQDQRERSIGVILSGMGSDGTLGLRAIKEIAGAVFVQEPASAKFDGMPRSAIEAGLADVVAPPEELPSRIAAYLAHVPLSTGTEVVIEKKAQSGLDKVVILLRAQTGHDFSMYKKTTVYRRIERRMAIHQITRIASYVRFLQENPRETELLFKELLIGVTSFFRDPPVWEQLQNEVLSALLDRRPPSDTLRAWVPACSTGEEAYSLAIAFREFLAKGKPARTCSLQIFATDLDRDAIDRARGAVFPANISADVPTKLLQRYFVQVDRGYQVAKSIREMVIFAPQNITMDPPFTKLDLLSCRNLLIYLNPELQSKLLPLFHYALNPGGYLLLGSAETIGKNTDLFAPLPGASRLYRRTEPLAVTTPVEFPSTFTTPRAGARHPTGAARPATNLESLANQFLLQRYAPATVLTNGEGDVVYISGRTGKYLEPAAGKANWNLFAMAREGLRYELAGAFQSALRRREVTTVKGVSVTTEGGVQAVDVTVHPIDEPEALRGMAMVVFNDVATPEPPAPTPANKTRPSQRDARLRELEVELSHSRHEVQATREEMQTSQEELKSANEELQSTNEELQSTNEELTTSKEELQSMNEELQTVNNELQAKLDELSQTGSDMRNLLDSTGIATLFLDRGLCVRRFTAKAGSITKLIPGDVGRPITDIASDLFYPDLAADVEEVLRELTAVEREVSTSDGGWFTVRILPYRTLENLIDGVVITYTEVTIAKALEAELRRIQGKLEARIRRQDVTLERSRGRKHATGRQRESGSSSGTKTRPRAGPKEGS